MSSTLENRAYREYLDLCKDWFFEAYVLHGANFDEIHEALVHYREPWISASTLRSAHNRWKRDQQPQPWPHAQPQRNTAYIIPPPPDVWGLVIRRHLSLPERPRPAHQNSRPHPHSAPRSFLPTSAIGTGGANASAYRPGLPSQQQALQPQQQQAQNLTASNSLSDVPNTFPYQPTSQTPPVVHQNRPPQIAEDNSEIDAEYEPDVPEIGSVCKNEDCGLIVGDNCQCDMYG